MEIVCMYPPNIDQIDSVLHVRGKKGLIFSYGHKIYVPGGEHLSEALIAHEEVHGTRQMVFSSPERWWVNYLENTSFRYEEELVAHVREYKRYCEYQLDRNFRARYIANVARRLSSDIYGNLVTYSKAINDLKTRI